ncbi:Myb/SANT-like DNA-binding domain-containing protein [Microdochium trichocladiopsis]|uniref:Myb/SANT-like DNA-binding domain-containing protein n=1 Tax=Microdochium trichocladiopsis TaxID=1682393 RepID=A0A9P8YCE9_9PEZI|nr:Myb/SANT-like DNA-binding domain-containing protein [Microdochium trichocladiopsis]KAH7035918.1 Myb/SANT-like DNA-binding domain-containing protein [Microdochium trichocladiopsis]
MSDDEGESSLAPGSTPRHKAPRFTWNSVYEETFFRSLCESIQLGFKEHQSFKAGAWERAALALRDKHNAYPEKSHLINKADNARKKFRLWRSLREDPEFLYNPATRTVTASDDAWKRHIQKEPLSKALRGRPFEHEEYLEILFPDVVGSGGAPKRIMRPRRKTLTSAEPDAIPSTALDSSSTMLNNSHIHDTSQFVHDSSQDHSFQHLQPGGPGVAPIGLTLPSASTANVLTPPDEINPNAQSRKRPNGDMTTPQQHQSAKRRGRPPRFSHLASNASPAAAQTPSSTTASAAVVPRPTATPALQPIHPSFQTNGAVYECFTMLAEALRSASSRPAPPRWQEQAVEILFRDFSDEDADLQLKIAEKALTDENKAMVFVKMTPALRNHWVGRLRDVHMRTQGSGVGPGGGLGRAIDEAS